MVHLQNVVARTAGIVLLTAVAALAEGEDDEVGSAVHVLTDENFDERVQGGKHGAWFVEFYAPWCGHCQKLTPEWDALPAILGSAVQVAKVDATTETRLATEFEIGSYPTLKMIANGKVYPYDGDRKTDAMAQWASGDYASVFSLSMWGAESLPSERTWFDDVKKSIIAFCASIGKVHDFMPAFLPALLGFGIGVGFFLASCCGLCRRGRIPREMRHTFDAKVARDDAGSLGIEIAPLTMMISKKDDRPALRTIEVGDTILAVNKCRVIDSDDYRRLSNGAKKLTLTMGRSSKSSNGNSKKEE